MNGEQKGGVKNHFRTLFRIIKEKKKKNKIIEEKEKVKKEINIQKNKIINYDFNNKKISNPSLKKVSKNNLKKTNKELSSIKNDIELNQIQITQNNLKIKTSQVKLTNDKKENNPKQKLQKIEQVNINEKKYKVVPKKTKVIKSNLKKGTKNNKKVDKIITKKENKVNTELEKSILKRINKIITDDKKDIELLKIELRKIDESINDANEKEKITKIKLQFEIIAKKIEKIKRDFEIIKENISFEEYEELNNYFLIDEIDDFKYHNDFASVELLSLKCKQQIEVLEEIVDLYENSIGVAKKVDSKQKQVKYFDENTPSIKSETAKIDLISKKINNNLNLQNKFIDEMNKKIGEAKSNTFVYYKYKGMNELLNNTLMMGVGLYSYSAMRRPRFKTLKFLVGSFLIYNSIKGMLKFLNPEVRRETYIYYNDYTKELEKGMSDIVMTHNILNSSIKDIDVLKSDFKNKFMPYQYELPEYDIMLEKIETIQKQLLLQKKELTKIEKELNEQKNKNKIYAKKMEKYTEYYK